MTLAIVSAMQQELAHLMDALPARWRQVKRAQRTYWLGNWHGQQLVVAVSRIGKVAAAATATTLIEHFNVKRIVFTGVAGGLAPHVKVGDMVVANAFLQHDMNAEPLFPRYEVPLTGLTEFTTDDGLNQALLQAAQHIAHWPAAVIAPNLLQDLGVGMPTVHTGLVASGDQFVATTAASATLQRELPKVLAAEMEGAAFAQVCHDYGVPFAAVRIISDRSDDAAHVDFTRFVNTVASHYSTALILGMLAALRGTPVGTAKPAKAA